MAIAYDILYASTALLTSPLWVYRLARTGKWRTDWPARFGRTPLATNASDEHPTLLIHAVSVGEVAATQPLVHRIHELTEQAWRVVISTTTDTGYARARELFEPQHTVVRYPLDFSQSVRRFLDAVRPDLVALAELELWPNFLSACDARGIPTCVITGRLSDRSYKRYRLVRPLVQRSFSQLSAAAVQTPEYAARFAALGTPQDRIHVLDSMKWDTATQASQINHKHDEARRNALASAMGIDRNKPLIVAGSTGPGEEQLLIQTQPENTQLLLVPRRPERFDQVAELAPNIIRRSRHLDGKAPADNPSGIFLLDTIGELKRAYGLADVAIVGRSFLGMYGSNPLEPIALGKPTIIGPHYSDFTDIVDSLRRHNGILVSSTPCQTAEELLQDPARAQALCERGMEVLNDRQGATDSHVRLLQRLMPKPAHIRASKPDERGQNHA